MIDRDTNYIFLYPMKSRHSQMIVEAYSHCYNCLKKQGFEAELIRLDNEISKELITAIENDKLAYQLVSPVDHRNSPSERAIQDAKAHFKSI